MKQFTIEVTLTVAASSEREARSIARALVDSGDGDGILHSHFDVVDSQDLDEG